MIDHIEYTVAFDEKTHEIKYIKTSDKDFVAEDGLRIGSELSLTREQFNIIPAWEIYAPTTPDGWLPHIGYDLYLLGMDSISKLKDGETRTVSISGFVKGGD
ncbi:MAG TPA: hypothetical protein VIQ24_15615 [Pyrinomonadaceae bacterium]